jgi:hypothetical protein
MTCQVIFAATVPARSIGAVAWRRKKTRPRSPLQPSGRAFAGRRDAEARRGSRLRDGWEKIAAWGYPVARETWSSGQKGREIDLVSLRSEKVLAV